MVRDPRKTWQYFAQAVIQEDDPAKLTYLMQQLYRVLKIMGNSPLERSKAQERGGNVGRSSHFLPVGANALHQQPEPSSGVSTEVRL